MAVTYILEAIDRSAAEDDPARIRYRDTTTSEKAAGEFQAIPRIQFTDSGHGIDFVARVHEGGKRGPKVDKLAGYVSDQLAIAAVKKTAKGIQAMAAMQKQLDTRQEYRMARQHANDSMAAKYVDDVQVLQRLGEEQSRMIGITRAGIRTTHLSDERITTEDNSAGNGPFSKWIHFPDGSDAGQVRGSRRWEVWR